MTPEWFPDWSGECCAIVAAGPSVKQQNIALLRDRIHVIAINESHKLAPWADMLYGCDGTWWTIRKGELKGFAGLKVSYDGGAAEIKRIKIKKNGAGYVNEILMDKKGEIGAGGNSGFQALNLAAQFGATAIALVGFDFCFTDRDTHWHGPHPPPLRDPTYENFTRWTKALDGAAGKLRELGIDVVNCSPISALKAFPKLTIEQMLERWSL